MLDLPHPFGPTIAVTPASNGRSTDPAKDLKPDSSNRLKRMVCSPSASRGRLVDPERAAELAADRLGLVPTRVGPEHDPIAVGGSLGGQDPRRQPRARQLLRLLARPRLVLGRRYLHVERP